MTNPLEIAPPRRLACPRCGTEFTCGLTEACWCADEAAGSPMPVDGEDCLCRDCLRKAAAGGPGLGHDEQLLPSPAVGFPKS